MKRIFILLLVLGTALTSSAQSRYTFVGVQGGAQNTYDTQYAFGRTWAPTAALSVGHFFTRDIGARLNFNGVWAKGNAPFQGAKTQQFDFNYLTTSADLLVGLSSIWSHKPTPFNAYLIGGFGWNHAWNNDEALALQQSGSTIMLAEKDHQNAFNLRLGLGLEYNICRHFAVNLEADYNYLAYGKSQRFTGAHNRFTALAGVAFKFGYGKKKKAELGPEVWGTRIDTVWYDAETQTPQVKNGEAQWEVFYEIRESDFADGAEAKLKAIGTFLKDFRDCHISVKSYADRQTGNPRINMMYSRQRAEKAVSALVSAGVNEKLIDSEYFGDTVQPYAENDRNRVTIIRATGLRDDILRGSQRRYRTEEVRYRVE